MTPESDDEKVRGLLADVGSAGPEPMPPEVAARLEDTLADLVGAREERASRRRWGPRLAVAAAAVVVLGLGGLTASTLGLFGTSPDDGASGGTAASDSSASRSPERSSGQSADESGAALPALSSATLEADVAALLAGDPSLSAESDGARLQGCTAPPGAGTGSTTTEVRLDGEPAVLLVGPVREGRRPVVVWSCSGERRLAAGSLTQ